MIKEVNITYIVFLLVFLYFFLVFDINFKGPDEPIYFAYSASIVEDGDLNVVNQLDSRYSYYFLSGKMVISKTYNFPDFHNHGGVILWAPFYAYAKGIYAIANKLNLKEITVYGLDRLTHCVMSFSTITFGFFTLLLTYLVCRIFFSEGISLCSTLTMFFGTPLFYYTLFEPGNANIIAALFSILPVWFISYVIGMKKSHWFLYGLFFSICVTLKTELGFQVFFIFSLLVILLRLKQASLLSGIFFLLGLLPGLLLKGINDYIKYGIFHIGELNLLNLRDFYFFEQILSPYRGFLYTSPILSICFAGFLLLFVSLKKNVKSRNSEKIMGTIFLLILVLYLIVKIALLGQRYAWGGGTVGARPLLSEFFIFVLLFAHTFQRQKKYMIYILSIASILFIFWNFLIISEYVAKFDLRYILTPSRLTMRIKTLEYILNPLFSIKDLELKLKLCLPWVCAGVAVVFHMRKMLAGVKVEHSAWYIIKPCPTNRTDSGGHSDGKKEDACSIGNAGLNKDKNPSKTFKIFACFTIYLYVAYAIITVVNICNNQKNVERLKAEGFFANAEFIKPREFEKAENIGSMNEMIEYFELRGDIDRVNKIKRYKKEIYGENG